jgi:hypothetical protein
MGQFIFNYLLKRGLFLVAIPQMSINSLHNVRYSTYSIFFLVIFLSHNVTQVISNFKYTVWHGEVLETRRITLVLIVVASGALVSMAGFMPLAQAINFQGTVTILGADCGILVTAGNPMSFGTLTNAQESSEQQVNIKNTGSVPGQLYLKGIDWKDTTTGNTEMNVGDTHFSWLTGQTYAQKNTLTGTDQKAMTILLTNGIAVGMLFQLKPTLINPAYSGDAAQIITASSFC